MDCCCYGAELEEWVVSLAGWSEVILSMKKRKLTLLLTCNSVLFRYPLRQLLAQLRLQFFGIPIQYRQLSYLARLLLEPSC